MKYKVMIGDQPYRVAMSDGEFYRVEYDKDVIVYTVDEDEQIIHARIEHPSEHTLYLISQGRCRMTISCRNFIGHSGIGYHRYDIWDPDDPRKINPSWYGIAHKSGLGRGSYRFHKHWSLCFRNNTLLNANLPILVTDVNDIEIPYHFQMARWIYDTKNVKGYTQLQFVSDNYEDPYRDEFYFDIRLALCSDQSPDSMISRGYTETSNYRAYSTNSKITRLTFTR